MYAEDFGKKAIEAIGNRAAERDCGAERSMARTVQTFNSLTGMKMTEREGWVFMVLLKLARAQAGKYQTDDYVDCAAYAMLAGECAYGIAEHDVVEGSKTQEGRGYRADQRFTEQSFGRVEGPAR